MTDFEFKATEYALTSLHRIANSAAGNAEIARRGVENAPQELIYSFLGGSCGSLLETEMDLDRALKIVRELKKIKSEIK